MSPAQVKELRTGMSAEAGEKSGSDWSGMIKSIISEIKSEQVHAPLIPDEKEMQVYETMSAMAAGTPFYGKLGGKNGILAIMLYAREIGMPPMSALNGGIDNIMGRLAISARSVNEKIRISGHYIQVKSISADECSIYGKRKDTGEEHTATFTIADAKRAGLYKSGGGYDKNPEDMMFARAISKLGRRLFPDVIKGAYIEGDYHDDSEQVQVQTQTPQEQKPSTIAGMLKAKEAATPKEIKKDDTCPVDTNHVKPSSQPKTEQEQPIQPEPTQPEKQKTNGGVTKEQQSKINGAKLISDLVKKHFGDDEILSDDFLRDTFKDSDIHPSLDNLTEFTSDQLRSIYVKVDQEIKKL